MVQKNANQGLLVAIFLCLFGSGIGGFFSFVAKAGAESFGALGPSLEAIDATFGVDNLFLAREEGVRSRRNLNFDQWIFLTIFPLDGFFALGGGPGQKFVACGFIHKHHGTIILGL